jgi:hypothetical protein
MSEQPCPQPQADQFRVAEDKYTPEAFAWTQHLWDKAFTTQRLLVYGMIEQEIVGELEVTRDQRTPHQQHACEKGLEKLQIKIARLVARLQVGIACKI